MGVDCQGSAQVGKAHGDVSRGSGGRCGARGRAGGRGLAVLVAVGIALLLATSSGIDLTPLWAQLGQSWATLTDALTQ